MPIRSTGFGKTSVADVDHAVFSVLLAVHHGLASFDIEVSYTSAGITCATLAANVNHAVLSMLPAESWGLAAFDIEGRLYRAGAAM